MPTTESKEWYAVYTRPRWEKKVFAGLEQAGIEAYCPLNKEVRQWSDRRKTVELPLFTSYVFVRVAPGEQTKVRMVPGVVNYVYWMGRLARIRDEEMDAIRDFVTAHSGIRVEKTAYEPGDTIEIANGIMKGEQAVVQRIRNNKLELIISSMNLRLIVDYMPPVGKGLPERGERDTKQSI